jgi:cystathionine gamma-synthase
MNTEITTSKISRPTSRHSIHTDKERGEAEDCDNGAILSPSLLPKRPEGVGDIYTEIKRALRSFPNPFFTFNPPLVDNSTTFFSSTAELTEYQRATAAQEPTRQEYGRYGNFTVQATAEAIAKIERAEASVLFPSGMAAVVAALKAVVPPGCHVIYGSDCYRQSREVIRQDLGYGGVTSTAVDTNDFASLREAVTPKTSAIFFETPSNPYLRVVDFGRLMPIVKQINEERENPIRLVIDSSFASPVNQTPLSFGVDLVVQSGTKYLSGHNSFLCGAVSGSKELMRIVADNQGRIGDIFAPSNAAKLFEQLSTVALRITRQNQSALEVATYLENHPKIEQVWYPGLPSHPDFLIAHSQMRRWADTEPGFGAVLSFTIRSDYEGTKQFLDRHKLAVIGPSFGGVDTLIEQPAHISYHKYDAAFRKSVGIHDNLVRFSCGIEGVDDIISDLEQALRDV